MDRRHLLGSSRHLLSAEFALSAAANIAVTPQVIAAVDRNLGLTVDPATESEIATAIIIEGQPPGTLGGAFALAKRTKRRRHASGHEAEVSAQTKRGARVIRGLPNGACNSAAAVVGTHGGWASRWSPSALCSWAFAIALGV
jgi:hypothetical protein